MFIRIDHYLGKCDRLLSDARELREEATRHNEAGNHDEAERLLEKHTRLVAKAMRYNDKAMAVVHNLEARR